LVFFLESNINLLWTQTTKNDIPWRQKCQNLFCRKGKFLRRSPDPSTLGRPGSNFRI